MCATRVVRRILCFVRFVCFVRPNATMYFSKNALLAIASWISMISTTAADYCEWGYCSLSEYCCGYNECCSDDKTTWILICGLLTVLVVASVCFGCFYRHIDYYRMRMQWLFGSNDPLISKENA